MTEAVSGAVVISHRTTVQYHIDRGNAGGNAVESVERTTAIPTSTGNARGISRVLLVATTRDWANAARLAMRFADTGCRVDAICPSGNAAFRTHAVSAVAKYAAVRPLPPLRQALGANIYDLVVPCDDLAAAHLHVIYRSELKHDDASGTAKLLRRSLGKPDSLAVISRRSRLMEVARDENICVPESAEVLSADELERWMNENGIPAVLKTDGSGGGRGVRVINTTRDSRIAFRILHQPSAIRVLKRVLVNQDLTVVPSFVRRQRPNLSVQRFIHGTDGTISISCWNGAVLASIAFEVIKTSRPNGPASVVRVINNLQMREAAARLAGRLGLSGLFGLDFRIDIRGCAHLIEMNPRATQSSHLAIGQEGDLVGSLVSACSGKSVPPPVHLPACSSVAFFPNEWQNDPQSAFLTSVYHDVPWSEPDLIRALIKKKPFPERHL